MNFGKKPADNDFIDSEEDTQDDNLIEDDSFDDGFNDNNDMFSNDMFGQDNNSVMEKFPELLKGMTNFESYKLKLYRGWMGITWDSIKKKYRVNPELKPIMNKKGSNWGKTLLETYSRNNNILSQLRGEEQADIIDGGLTDTLFSNLADNYYHFNFENSSAVLRVWNEIDHGALLAISGSDGSYSKVLAGRDGGMMQYREGNMSQQQMQVPKKLGMFKRLLGMKQ